MDDKWFDRARGFAWWLTLEESSPLVPDFEKSNEELEQELSGMLLSHAATVGHRLSFEAVLWEFAVDSWSAGSDPYRLCEALKDGPADYATVLKALLPLETDRSARTKRFEAVRKVVNDKLRQAGFEIHVAKDGPNRVVVKSGYALVRPGKNPFKEKSDNSEGRT